MKRLVVWGMLCIAPVVQAYEYEFVPGIEKAERVLVKKAEKKLFLISNGKPFREYRVVLGPKPRGPKMAYGDERTPEGDYTLDRKNENSAFYKSIRISYPNHIDRARSERAGIDDPGGAIMIHGQPAAKPWPEDVAQTFNWTNGCIAVTDGQMDEIWASVDVGTPITIQP
jgi:murein L,D-transpeptidase YafK